ncbi:hypothetical protein [Marinomonas foliarum]|uniref:hypothetical protein n=1 Tax=Marinomonas foliarum TaxID=491950 RepID=UPI0015F0FC23|nr:hypothetical protein [Marinomonas foliarum]
MVIDAVQDKRQSEVKRQSKTVTSSDGVWFARISSGGQRQWIPAFAGMTADRMTL